MMWMMFQQDQFDDYVVGINEMYSVKEFCQVVFVCVGFDWEKYVKYDVCYECFVEVELFIGDLVKVKKQFGWELKVWFKELVEIMVDYDFMFV